MADTSLDEFFAKKDKSKKSKSGKAKYTTTETIAKKLEESGKKSESLPTPKKEKEKSTPTSNTQQTSVAIPLLEQDNDDWKDIEEEKEKDYSGLKVQSLSISEKEKEEELSKEQMLEENGESSRNSDGNAGPWKLDSSAASNPVSDNIEEQKEEAPPKTVGAYRVPQLRNAGGPKRKPKAAPEISSEVHFPSLSASVDNPKGSRTNVQDKSFQSVKHGVRSRGEVSPQGPQLDLENKFAALHQGDIN